jgi:hypothetical protein
LISALVLVTSLIAIVMAFHPKAWEYVGRPAPSVFVRLFGGGRRPDRSTMPVGSAPTADAVPTSSRFVGRRKSSQTKVGDATRR